MNDKLTLIFRTFIYNVLALNNRAFLC